VKAHQATILNLLELVMKITSALEFQVWEHNTLEFVPIHEICPLLDTTTPVLSFEPQNISRKAYFEYVHLSAIKIVIDFKTTRKEVNLQIDPRNGFGVV
jgi:hypothetical protein